MKKIIYQFCFHNHRTQFEMLERIAYTLECYKEEMMDIHRYTYNLDFFKEKDEVIGFLMKINNELDGTPFKIAYRVRDEFLIYCFYASQNPTDNWLTNALDEMTSMKILSRIEGDETKTGDVIEKLLKLLDATFQKSHNKLIEMKNKLQFGYTSFWL